MNKVLIFCKISFFRICLFIVACNFFGSCNFRGIDSDNKYSDSVKIGAANKVPTHEMKDLFSCVGDEEKKAVSKPDTRLSTHIDSLLRKHKQLNSGKEVSYSELFPLTFEVRGSGSE